jgi:hypothetical protein
MADALCERQRQWTSESDYSRKCDENRAFVATLLCVESTDEIMTSPAHAVQDRTKPV